MRHSSGLPIPGTESRSTCSCPIRIRFAISPTGLCSYGRRVSASIFPDGSSVGQTPLAALGATDQHSQVQLFMEGPLNKVVSFVAVEEREADVVIPHGFEDVTELRYLGGHSLAELIDIEQRATAGALAARGRPNLTIHLERVDEWHVGGMIMLLELATAYAGQLYGVDAFNQPGVELGKQFAYALLGRPGSDDARKEWESIPACGPPLECLNPCNSRVTRRVSRTMTDDLMKGVVDRHR